MSNKTIEYLRRRTAELAIGNSTLRNQGAPGVAKAARAFLSQLDLKSFSVSSEEKFVDALDRATEKLVQVLPYGARNWGTARKALNIFLRDCLYNQFLCTHFAISQVHPWLEVPLDSYVAKGLRGTFEGNCLPKWTTITGLEHEPSDQYQKVAGKVAEKIGCNRVDLDIYLWREVGIRELENV
ncbi:MAG TPA: hypothetical protein PLK94_11100 [Alphaproteobacteria bacterium]|nr:hypothetical protein [Alphaproteobacteria bacterium]